MKLKSISALVLAVSMVPSLVFGQGLIAKLKAKLAGHKPAAGSTMHKGMMSHMGGMHMGNIIGNKNTKVYHLPGDKNLPEEKNRVYFTSTSAAEEAGYHASGSKAGSSTKSTMTGGSAKSTKGTGKMMGMKHMKGKKGKKAAM